MGSTESSMDMDSEGESFTEKELVTTDDSDHANESSVEESETFADDSDELKTDRMIIHTAHLQIQVKDFNKTQLNIENKVEKYGGYIVDSNVYKENDQQLSGHMTVRIPEKHFQTFLTDTEERSEERRVGK